MRMTRKGDDSPSRKEVREMAANEAAGKREGEGRPEPSPQNSETGEMSEEEIIKTLQIAQLEERLKRELERIQKEKEELERKKESAKETIFAEMEKKYNMKEKEFRDAFRDIQRKGEIEREIIETIRKKGENACKEKTFKECAEKIKKISVIERMSDDDIKKISIYIEDARKYIEEKQIEQGKQQIHHRGRMSTEALMMLKYVKEQGGRIQWKELLQYAKEELGLDGDTTNKRRWNLLTKEYIRREGNELVLTQKGYARLGEEGY